MSIFYKYFIMYAFEGFDGGIIADCTFSSPDVIFCVLIFSFPLFSFIKGESKTAGYNCSLAKGD